MSVAVAKPRGDENASPRESCPSVPPYSTDNTKWLVRIASEYRYSNQMGLAAKQYSHASSTSTPEELAHSFFDIATHSLHAPATLHLVNVFLHVLLFFPYSYIYKCKYITNNKTWILLIVDLVYRCKIELVHKSKKNLKYSSVLTDTMTGDYQRNNQLDPPNLSDSSDKSLHRADEGAFVEEHLDPVIFLFLFCLLLLPVSLAISLCRYLLFQW